MAYSLIPVHITTYNQGFDINTQQFIEVVSFSRTSRVIAMMFAMVQGHLFIIITTGFIIGGIIWLALSVQASVVKLTE